MCLWKVEKYPEPELEGTFWKVFQIRKQNGKELLFSQVINNGIFEKPRETNVWLQATEKTIKALDFKNYKTGFHGYKHIHDAKRACWRCSCVIRKCKFRGGHTIGKQSRWDKGNTVVAREIMILDDEEIK